MRHFFVFYRGRAMRGWAAMGVSAAALLDVHSWLRYWGVFFNARILVMRWVLWTFIPRLWRLLACRVSVRAAEVRVE